MEIKLARMETAQRQTPESQVEKTKEKLYLEALIAKRDLYSSHYAMNTLRRSIDKRIESLDGEQLKNDPEVQKYELVRSEYQRRKDLFNSSLESMDIGDAAKMASLTNLTAVEVELSMLEALTGNKDDITSVPTSP